jgi:hypothetical protein
MNMAAIFSSKMSVYFYQITWRHMLDIEVKYCWKAMIIFKSKPFIYLCLRFNDGFIISLNIIVLIAHPPSSCQIYSDGVLYLGRD